MTKREFRAKPAKILVLFSGGLDSTTLLYHTIDLVGKDNVGALSMYYGQRHIKEQQCAEDICNMLMIPRYVKDLSTVFEFSSSSMLAQGVDIPHGEYAEQLHSQAALDEHGNINSYVPFRNGLFLSVAAAIAYSLGYDAVAYGAHSDDAAGEAYPDCTPTFVSTISEAIALGTGHQIQVLAPFIECTKKDIVERGLSLNVPFEHTWSCYEGGEHPCGTCGTCVDRIKAFELNGTVDPLMPQM